MITLHFVYSNFYLSRLSYSKYSSEFFQPRNYIFTIFNSSALNMDYNYCAFNCLYNKLLHLHN